VANILLQRPSRGVLEVIPTFRKPSKKRSGDIEKRAEKNKR